MLNLESCQSNEEDEEKVLNKNIKAGVIYTAALHLCSQQLSQEPLKPK